MAGAWHGKAASQPKPVHHISPRKDGEIPTNYRFWDHITEVAVLIGCSAGQSHPDASEYALIKLSFPGFNTHCLTPKCSKGSDYHQAVSSPKIIVLKKTLCQQNCQPHIRCSEASKSSTLITTSWQRLGQFHKSHVDHGKNMIFPYRHDHRIKV